MIKNKEDDFLGDSITNNIKFAANEWQAQGTVDRTCMYMPEGILDLVFENTQYNRETGMCKYTPRATFSEKNYAAAKLSHDIILVNKLFYQSSPLSSYKNIFGLDDFLSYGIGVVNPVYDPLARDEKIYLLNKEKILNGTCAIAQMTLEQFCNIFNPISFQKGALTSFDDNVMNDNATNKYASLSTANVITQIKAIYGAGEAQDKMTDLFANNSFNVDKFVEDFSVTLHDPESIKLPYFARKSDDGISSQEKFKFFTRYFPNLSAVNESLASGYVEKVSPVIEDLLNEADKTLSAKYDDATQISLTGFTLDSSTGDSYRSPSIFNTASNIGEFVTTKMVKDGKLSKEWENLIPEEYLTDAVNLGSALKFIGDALHNGGYNNFLSDLYLGWDSANNILNSTGIHLVVEEDKSAVFRSDDDENYTIYSGLVLGYRLVDNLIAQRTFLGTVFQLAAGWDGDDDNKTIWKSQPFNKTQKGTVTLASGDSYKLTKSANAYMGYCTIDMLKYMVVGSNSYIEFTDFIAELLTTNNLESFEEDYLRPFYRWLKEETFLFKAPIYGDFVEELNFMQDLTPDSKVQFAGGRIKKTAIPYKRFQDSKYEVPYVEKTSPLINLSDAEKTTKTHATEAMAGVGYRTQTESKKDGTVPGCTTTPPFIYDYDKGDEGRFISDKIDARSKTKGEKGDKQRINDVGGDFVVEGRITSKTIDELWQFLKFLSESTGRGGRNNLPKFYGLLSNELGFDISTDDAETIRVNPKYTGTDAPEIDILDWAPIVDYTYKPYFGTSAAPEMMLGGYKITKAIPKVLDYKVNFFGRKGTKDGDTYEYNTEDVNGYGDVVGYLDQLLNNTTINFNVIQSGIEDIKVIDSFNKEFAFGAYDAKLVPTAEGGTLTNTEFSQASKNRQKALIKIGTVLDYHKGTSIHNHYKEYLDNPKNLKTIERDLEAIRQNLQTLTEYMVMNFACMGFADRSTNRGTLHTLHRNSFDFNDAYLETTGVDEKGEDISKQIAKDTLNNVKEVLKQEEGKDGEFRDIKNNLIVTALDKRVVFDDGDFANRYQHHVVDEYGPNDYDRSVIDLSGPEINTRAEHAMYEPNVTLLSEVYLAADGTWRSVHEHIVLPILDDDY